MLRIFKKKSKIEVLQKKYERLLKESYQLSTVNRKASDEKVAEANAILKEIEHLETVKRN
ncbi:MULTISPECIES: Lacal_2735 family protein [unclassified Saccharicrinis]|uniref:Lacal_2735 family protein n=1 Tax=unclassified Saccharicrinis TaxID=2646859 RepID=UPI003D32A785